MPSNTLEIYEIGLGKIPAWVEAEVNTGRIRMITDDDGGLQEVIVNTVTGIKRAHTGDVILKKHSGVTVVSGEQAEKYKLKPKKEAKKTEGEDNAVKTDEP